MIARAAVSNRLLDRRRARTKRREVSRRTSSRSKRISRPRRTYPISSCQVIQRPKEEMLPLPRAKQHRLQRRSSRPQIKAPLACPRTARPPTRRTRAEARAPPPAATSKSRTRRRRTKHPAIKAAASKYNTLKSKKERTPAIIRGKRIRRRMSAQVTQKTTRRRAKIQEISKKAQAVATRAQLLAVASATATVFTPPRECGAIKHQRRQT